MSIYTPGRVASAGESQEFMRQGMEQLDHLLLEEADAKLGVLVGIGAGENIIGLGDPGGGKTTLAENMHRLIEGVGEDQVASIPIDAELSPRELIGGAVTTTKKVGDEEVTETVIIDNPIIRRDTKFIFADEINRTSPFAVNATLGATESGTFSTTEGRVVMKDFIGAFSTMNPAESKQAVFPVSAATASRYSIGVVLGEDEPGKEGQVAHDIMAGWDSRPDEVQPIVTLEGLKAIRNRISTAAVALPENLVRELGVPAVLDAVQILRQEVGVRETDRRMSRQVRNLSKAIAVLNGQETVESEDMKTAIRLFLTARAGMLASGNAIETSGQVIAAVLE